MKANCPARSVGVGDGVSRRPIGYWAALNNWWRTKLSEDGCKPSQSELTQWFEANAPLCWGSDGMPSLQEVRTHAKCLRSPEQVRNYFRKYRATRKASAASVRASGSDSDSDGTAPSFLSISTSDLHSSRIVATGGAVLSQSQSREQGGSSSQPGRTAVTTGADPRGLLPFALSSSGNSRLFLTDSGRASAGLAALKAAAAAESCAAAAAVASSAAGMTSPNVGGLFHGGRACSPRSYKLKPITSSMCSGPLPLPGHHPPHQKQLQLPDHQSQLSHGSVRYVFGSGSVGTLRPDGVGAGDRFDARVPPIAAAACGPIISFSSDGQLQHSPHRLGPARSTGGDIGLRLPALHYTPSTSGGGSVPAPWPTGSTLTKHSSPTPPAPTAKRHATAHPAWGTDQMSSVHLAEFPVALNCAPSVCGASSLSHSRHTTLTDVQIATSAVPSSGDGSSFFAPTVTSGMRESRSFTASHTATFVSAFPHFTDTGSRAAGSGYGPMTAIPCPSEYAPLPLQHHQYDNTYPSYEYGAPPTSATGLLYSGQLLPLPVISHTAAAASTAAAMIQEQAEALAVLHYPPVQPTMDEIAGGSGALSPTQAYSQSWTPRSTTC